MNEFTNVENLELIIQNYYDLHHKAVRIYKEELDENDFNILYSSLDVLNSEKRFYKLSSRTFGLLVWLLEEVTRYLEYSEFINFQEIERIAQDVYGFSTINRSNLKEIFNLNADFYDLDYIKFVKKEYIGELVPNKINFDSVMAYLQQSHTAKTLEQIATDLIINKKSKASLEIFLNTDERVHNNGNSAYFYSDKSKTLQSLLYNSINVLGFAESLSLKLLLVSILNFHHMPMTLNQIDDETMFYKIVDHNLLINTLEDNEEFLEIDDGTWILKQWRNQSLAELLIKPRDIYEIILIKGIDLINLEAFITSLNLHSNIHLDDEGMYYYSNKAKSTDCLIANCMNLISFFEYKRPKELLVCLLKRVDNSMRFADILEKMSVFIEIDNKGLENILCSDKIFMKAGYNKWGLSEWKGCCERILNFPQAMNSIKESVDQREWLCFMKYEVSPYRITLEEIGQELNITRERVRQILKKAVSRLKDRSRKNIVQPYIEYINDMLLERNVVLIDDLSMDTQFINFFGKIDIYLLISFLRFYGGNFSVVKGRYLVKTSVEEITNRINVLLLKLRENQIETIDKYKLSRILGLHSENGVQLMLEIIKEDSRFIVLSENNRVVFSNSRLTKADLIYVALRNIGNPVHNSIIRKEYNKIFDEKMSVRNILSILDREPRFVRVFTGMYALSEWGCEPHKSCIDLAIDAMENIKQAMHYTKIYEAIKEKTRAKEMSLYAFLSLDERIIGLGEGVYALSKWTEEEGYQEKYGLKDVQIFQSKSNSRIVLETFKNKYGYLVNKCRISEATLSKGYIRVGKEIEDFLVSNIYMLDAKDGLYNLTYSSYSTTLYRLTSFFRKRNISSNDILYFEYISPEIMRIFTEHEYTYEYIPYETQERVVAPVDQQEPTIEEEIVISDIESLKQYGLKYGYVYSDDVENIDFSSQYQSITELMMDFMDTGIEFLDK